MRQVINKLIREEDLYGAVEAPSPPGLAADEALLPHRPADRDRRRHARHRRPGPQLRRHRAAPHEGRRVTVSVGGFVPKPFTPFQWFGQNTPAELRRKVGLLRDGARVAKGVQLKWHDPKATRRRGHRRPGRPPPRPRHRDRLAAGRHVPGVERALRLDLWLDAMADARPRPRLVRPPAPHRGRGPAVGPHLGRASTRTSCGRTGRTPSPSSACPTAAGPPATTAAPAPATASSTSWPRPPRPPAAARAPARTCRPVSCPAPCPSRRGRDRSWRPGRDRPGGEGAPPLLQARQGPLHQPPRRRPHLGAGPAPGRRRRSPTPRASRPGPSCSFGLALPDRPRVARPSTSTSTWRDAPEPTAVEQMPGCSPRRSPRASTCRPSRSSPPGAESLQQAVTSCTWYIEIGDRAPREVAAGVAGRWPPTELPVTRERKGRRSPTTCGPQSSPCGCSVPSPRSSTARPGRRPRHASRPTWPPSPGAVRPAELVAACRSRLEPRCGSHEPPMDRSADGARREVMDLGPAATPPPHAEARAS